MQAGEILASQQRICWLSISTGSDTRMHAPKIRSPGTLLEPFSVGLQSWANVSHLVSFGYWFFPCADGSQVANLSRHAHVRQLELDTAFWAAWHGPNQETPSFSYKSRFRSGISQPCFMKPLGIVLLFPAIYSVFTPSKTTIKNHHQKPPSKTTIMPPLYHHYTTIKNHHFWDLVSPDPMLSAAKRSVPMRITSITWRQMWAKTHGGDGDRFRPGRNRGSKGGG